MTHFMIPWTHHIRTQSITRWLITLSDSDCSLYSCKLWIVTTNCYPQTNKNHSLCTFIVQRLTTQNNRLLAEWGTLNVMFCNHQKIHFMLQIKLWIATEPSHSIREQTAELLLRIISWMWQERSNIISIDHIQTSQVVTWPRHANRKHDKLGH